MPRGGARINSGPPPDPNALRRDRPSDQAGWVTLPAAGRKGRPPEWPLPADIRLTSAIEVAEGQLEILEAQAAAGIAARGSEAKIAKLDQMLALLRAKLAAGAELELELWRSVWKTPQATVWTQLHWTREVAIYVRWQVQGELGDIDAAKEARQWSDRLGLNPAGMLRLRWRLATVETAAAPARRTSSSSKDRFTLIAGGDA